MSIAPEFEAIGNLLRGRKSIMGAGGDLKYSGLHTSTQRCKSKPYQTTVRRWEPRSVSKPGAWGTVARSKFGGRSGMQRKVHGFAVRTVYSTNFCEVGNALELKLKVTSS